MLTIFSWIFLSEWSAIYRSGSSFVVKTSDDDVEWRMSLSAQIKDEGAKSMVNAHLVQPLEGII